MTTPDVSIQEAFLICHNCATVRCSESSKSAQRYKGVAKITSRRARKGFQLRFNPDSHWSSAMYRTLNVLQYTDGLPIININRDDASGF